LQIGSSRDNDGLDLSDRPVFKSPVQRLSDVAKPIAADVGLLAFGVMLAFVGSFVSFLRNDLR
jgi:hypothetical protein